MEERMKKYRQVSPERAKVWTEKSPKYHQQQPHRKVSVVYYLSRNRQLEHPHFIQVPLSSPDGLYLRGKDFILCGCVCEREIERILIVLREREREFCLF